ncbi:hypothetical protein Bhyg_00905 [Pseudolycoriella hygida]|uniref:Uncharacterized protein n=1 Tax=Pseudolycoriella hygida TaxID=35572 RepID=A0A9Q0S509_9DIPT|nr:hypothetical protein Bhyg_00905 [Pseudolycoriella hygida]
MCKCCIIGNLLISTSVQTRKNALIKIDSETKNCQLKL